MTAVIEVHVHEKKIVLLIMTTTGLHTMTNHVAASLKQIHIFKTLHNISQLHLVKHQLHLTLFNL
jgi:hypothetical protein